MKLQVPFLQLPILFDAPALAAEVAAVDTRWWRGRTQRDDGNSALTLITTHGDPDSDELGGPMRPTPVLAQCPYLMQVLEALGAIWGRARLMRLSGQAEVRAHVDINYYWRERMRVHVPIVTTPPVRFQCGEGEINMAAGECWIFDTWRRHRVLNGGDDTRIHLVADTVGGERFWDLLAQARPPGARGPDWRPARIAPRPGLAAPVLEFESFNAPKVMSPWELREHIVFLLGEAVPDPRLAAIQQALLRFARRWQALWAAYADGDEGLPRYRRLLDGIRGELEALGAGQIGLKNELGLLQALAAHVFDMAVATPAEAGDESRMDRHGDPGTGVHAGAAAVPLRATEATAVEGARDPLFERPLFIVSPPRSGSTLLFETLATAPGLYSPGDESHALIEGILGLAPSARGYDSNRLLAEDATAAVATALRERLFRQLRDREGRAAAGAPVRVLEKTPKNSLRIPFLRAIFPEARFVFLYRDPRQVLGSMIDGWRSGDFAMYPRLPGWEGPTWSFLLTPGWREGSGRPLEEVVARQWASATRVLLDDLRGLPSGSWTTIRHEAFVADPQAGAERLCGWAGLGWDRRLDAALPLSRYTLTPPDPQKWRRHEAAIEAQRALWDPVARRAEALLDG
ncbi:sulfotransferase [Pseudoxanthomonas suwonensis]|uniref:sulfotransferase n=1 Tax=Pseudoxanthomonas suwonensis TaxID=314722 RepID=UPI000697A456|nr:sulfotransferase [Pseudoxanthomonas suwonensis]